MTRIDPNGPAFPNEIAEPTTDVRGGLTIRAYFAGLALIGESFARARDGAAMPKQNVADRAVAIADALIAELNKEPRP